MDNKVTALAEHRASDGDTFLTGTRRAPPRFVVSCAAGREGLTKTFGDLADAARYADEQSKKHPGEMFDLFQWKATFRFTPQLEITVPGAGE